MLESRRPTGKDIGGATGEFRGLGRSETQGTPLQGTEITKFPTGNSDTPLMELAAKNLGLSVTQTEGADGKSQLVIAGNGDLKAKDAEDLRDRLYGEASRHAASVGSPYTGNPIDKDTKNAYDQSAAIRAEQRMERDLAEAQESVNDDFGYSYQVKK